MSNKTQNQADAIQTEEQLREQLREQGWWVSIPISTFPAHWLVNGDQRLDGGFYANDAFLAQRIVRESKYPSKTLSQWQVTAYHPTQSQPRSNFKRIYASRESGEPYLSASEMYVFRLNSDRYLSYTMEKLDELRIAPNTMVMSRSGTVAHPLIVNETLSKFVITDDALRISSGDLPLGYLYAFLSTWIGRALVSKNQYGVTVKHIEASHLLSTPCPLLEEDKVAVINKQILDAYHLRDKGNELIDEAEDMLHRELRLPEFDENLVPYLHPPVEKKSENVEIPHPRAFVLPMSELGDRLDASFHVPITRTAIMLLHKGPYEVVQLGSVLKDVFYPGRFQRVYVDADYGVPFLQGSHLSKNQIFDLQYLSKRANAKQIEECRILEDWVLVTRSGTTGTIGIVTKAQDQWTASEHLLRLIPDMDRIHPGYLVAFLSTPYGQHQLTSKIYGGVVDELTEDDIKSIWLPIPDGNIQNEIGERIRAAYKFRDQANELEAKAIANLEKELENSLNQM